MIEENRKLLLDALVKDRKKYMNFARRIVKNIERAEDVLQIVAEYFLTCNFDFKIDHPKTFIGTCIQQRSLNYLRDNKRYAFTTFDNKTWVSFMDSLNGDYEFEQDMVDSLTCEKIIEKIGDLTVKQKDAVLGILYHDSIGESAGTTNYNTHKANRLWGIKALQKSLNL